MRDLLFIAALLVGLISPAWAQNTITTTGAGGKHGAAAFTGVGDTVASAKGYWGVFAYNSAARGTKALNLCNAADVACVDVNTDATTGIVSSTQVVGLITCDNGGGANKCTVKTVYDQSGASNCSGVCDMAQATITNRPVFVVNCSGTVPCLGVTAGANQFVAKASGFTAIGASAAFTIVSGFNSHNDTGGNARTFAGVGGLLLGNSDSSSKQYVYNGSALLNQSSTDTTDTFYSTIGLADASGNGTIGINGTTTTGTAIGTSGSGAAVSIGCDTAGSNCLHGQIMDVGIWATNFSGGQITSMSATMRALGGY